MNIREYRYILEIARQGGVSKAAAVLHISRPSLSAYLKTVEKRLGTRLFDISAGGVHPTPTGTVYLKYAKQIVGMDDNLMETLEGIHQRRSGVVRMGITGARSAYLTPRILTACAHAHPGIELHIQEHNSSALEDLAGNQRSLDIILVNELPRSSGLVRQVLFQEQVLLAVPVAAAEGLEKVEEPGHALPWVDLAQLANTPFALMRSGHRLRQMSDRLFLDSGISPPVLMESQYPNTAFSLTKAGLAACLLYDSYLFEHRSPEIAVFRVGSRPILLSFAAAYLQESLAFPPVRAILDTTVQTVMETYKDFREKSEYPLLPL